METELSLKRICQGKSEKRIYLTITVINRIFSIVYTKKKKGKLRMYINYRQLNSIIKKD